jgi:DNA recombination protein RmuC
MNLPVLITLVLALAILALQVLILLQKKSAGGEKIEKLIDEKFRAARDEALVQGRELRMEIAENQRKAGESITNVVSEFGRGQQQHLETIRRTLDERLDRSGETLQTSLKTLEETERGELTKVREALAQQFREIRESNERKLDEMRMTVDEKLQSTLKSRFDESFKLVSERLDAVHKGLGEMQNLATGVGDLKRVLTNVKERGTWGEYQLGAILEDILTPDQFERNVAITEGGERVEFAVRLPGGDAQTDRPVWLPIDSKFPKEDYERLVDASRAGDSEGTAAATRGLLAALRKSAKDISEKYISPPATTDFGVMFLPTEGLYAEVLREPGFHDELQRKHRVVVAGPTTLCALLNSLRVGFHTLAIEKQAHEVWKVLGAVKIEFGKFDELLEKVKKQLEVASHTIDKTAIRSRAMNRKLRDVEKLPAGEGSAILEIAPAEVEEEIPA